MATVPVKANALPLITSPAHTLIADANGFYGREPYVSRSEVLAAKTAAETAATTAVAAKDATIAAATYTYQDIAAIDALTSGQIVNGKYYHATKEGATYLAVASGGDVPGMTQAGRFSVAASADHGIRDPRQYGAVGNGTTNDATAIQAMIDNGYDLVFPAEYTFGISSQLTLPNRPIRMLSAGGGQAGLKALASMTSMLYMPDDQIVIRSELQGIKLNCNDLAQKGFVMERGKAWIIDDLDITGFTDTGMVLGVSGASGAWCYENQIYRLRIDGGIAKAQAGTHPPYGLVFTDGATDNKVVTPVVSYVNSIGVDLSNSGNNCIIGGHVYGYVDYSYVLGGECEAIDCFADTARVAYFRVTGERAQIIGGKAYGNTGAGGYNANAVAFSLDAARAITVVGTRLRNVGYDFVQAPSDTSTVVGVMYSSVANQSRRRNWQGGSMRTSGATGAEARIGSPSGQRSAVILHDDTDKSLWRIGKNAGAQTGSDAGANLDFDSYDDAGTYKATPMSITRSNSRVNLGHSNGAGEVQLRIPTSTTAPSAGAGGALPATPAGYATIYINGTARQIAYY